MTQSLFWLTKGMYILAYIVVPCWDSQSVRVRVRERRERERERERDKEREGEGERGVEFTHGRTYVGEFQYIATNCYSIWHYRKY